MSIIIVFQSKHGCAEKAAWKLQDAIKEDIFIHDLSKSKKVNLHKADAVILGASIHAGKIQKRMRALMDDKKSQLLSKPLGLYMCCMETGDKAEEQFNNNYTEELRDHATAKGFFGGEFNFEKMNIFEKSIVKKVANVHSSVSKYDEQIVEEFAAKMNEALSVSD